MGEMRKTVCRKCGAEYYKSGGGPINDCPKCAPPDPCPSCAVKDARISALEKVAEAAKELVTVREIIDKPATMGDLRKAMDAQDGILEALRDALRAAGKEGR